LVVGSTLALRVALDRSSEVGERASWDAVSAEDPEQEELVRDWRFHLAAQPDTYWL
jgi:hypothetical protein